jgi:hypothetical protein
MAELLNVNEGTCAGCRSLVNQCCMTWSDPSKVTAIRTSGYCPINRKAIPGFFKPRRMKVRVGQGKTKQGGNR